MKMQKKKKRLINGAYIKKRKTAVKDKVGNYKITNADINKIMELEDAIKKKRDCCTKQEIAMQRKGILI